MRLKLVDVKVVGGEGGQQDTGVVANTTQAQAGESALTRALVERLVAERALLEDVGSLVKELASKAEAEAFMAQSDRKLHEYVVDETMKLKEKVVQADGTVKDGDSLIVVKARSELERDIARNKDQANRQQHNNNGSRHHGRRDQRQTGPRPSAAPGDKEVRVTREPFNRIRAATDTATSPQGDEKPT